MHLMGINCTYVMFVCWLEWWLFFFLIMLFLFGNSEGVSKYFLHLVHMVNETYLLYFIANEYISHWFESTNWWLSCNIQQTKSDVISSRMNSTTLGLIIYGYLLSIFLFLFKWLRFIGELRKDNSQSSLLLLCKSSKLYFKPYAIVRDVLVLGIEGCNKIPLNWFVNKTSQFGLILQCRC